MTANHPPKPNNRRLIYRLAPFLFLVGVLVVINNWPGIPVAPPPTATAVAASVTPIPATATETAVRPTFTPPVPTATPLPTLAPEAHITLLGPPENATILAHNQATFFWQWDDPLPEGHVLALYLLAGSQEVQVGQLDAPNLGALYQLTIVPAEWTTATEAQWQVRLLNMSDQLRLSSQTRSMTLWKPTS